MGNKGRQKPDVRKGRRNLRDKSAETRGGLALIPKNKPVRAGEGNGNAETGSDPRRSGKRRKGSPEQCSHLPGKKRAQARMEPDPAEIAGGDAPPCAEPPAAPNLYQCTAEP